MGRLTDEKIEVQLIKQTVEERKTSIASPLPNKKGANTVIIK